VLGKRLKYSCCYWPEGVRTLEEAEEAMLRLTCERARLEDGMDVLDLGCGWGSLCHMKNYEQLMAKIASFLKPGGKLFVHIFSHREFAYEFDANNPDDWMAQTFFTGGTMPSDDLLLHFQRNLCLVDHWCMSGSHYAKTLGAWLVNLDHHEAEVRRVVANAYGADKETLWLVNWRLFFMACEETWKLNKGNEYLVSHYLFESNYPGQQSSAS
jgi:cyclopropane-fatty-acyl-phospholipid synthase